MPNQRDEVRLPDGRIRIAYDVGDYLTIGGLERAWKAKIQRNASEVMVWYNGRAVLRLYGVKDIEVLGL